MDIATLLPWIVIAIVVLVGLRMVIGAVKSSAKMMLWLVVLLAGGFGWLWWQGQINPTDQPANPVGEYSQSNF